MSNGYVIPIDPADFNHYQGYDPREDQDEEPEEEVELSEEELALLQSQSFRDRIEPLLDLIPLREADIIFLYFLHGKRQADIAEIFNITQAAVSYRLSRGIKRVQFLLNIPQVTEEQLREDLPQVFSSQLDVDILVGMWRTTCQSEVASELRVTQGCVRHRFFKAVDKLREAAKKDERLEPYSQIFGAIAMKKFNILREVKLPQWSDRGVNECL